MHHVRCMKRHIRYISSQPFFPVVVAIAKPPGTPQTVLFSHLHNKMYPLTSLYAMHSLRVEKSHSASERWAAFMNTNPNAHNFQTCHSSPHLSCIWHDIFPLLRIEGRDSFSCLFRVCWFRLDSVVLIRNIWKNTPGKEVTSIHIANAKQEKFPFLYLMAFSFRWSYCRAVATVRWYFEPSQPQRITSRPKTMFNLSLIYSAHKSSNHISSKNHNISPDTNPHNTKNTQTSNNFFSKN